MFSSRIIYELVYLCTIYDRFVAYDYVPCAVKIDFTDDHLTLSVLLSCFLLGAAETLQTL